MGYLWGVLGVFMGYLWDIYGGSWAYLEKGAKNGFRPLRSQNKLNISLFFLW